MGQVTESNRLDGIVCTVGRARRKMLATLANALLAIRRGRHDRALGFAGVHDYAAARLEFSRRKTTELVELAERAEELPQIRAAFEAGSTHWTKLRTIARVARAENEGLWLERAQGLSSRALERAAAEEAGAPPPKIHMGFDFTPEQCADLEDAVRAIRRARNENISREAAILELMRRGLAGVAGGTARAPFQTILYRCKDCEAASRETRDGPVAASVETAGRAACDSDVVDSEVLARISRTIPPAVRRFVLARDRGRCVVPGCCNRDFLEVHHIRPRAHGGDHHPAGLATLCDAHHTAVHAGKLKIEGRMPEPRFVRADGTELAENGPASCETSETAALFVAALVEEPLTIDDLIERTGVAASKAFVTMTELELAGLARKRNGWVELMHV